MKVFSSPKLSAFHNPHPNISHQRPAHIRHDVEPGIEAAAVELVAHHVFRDKFIEFRENAEGGCEEKEQRQVCEEMSQIYHRVHGARRVWRRS